jgi:hypothetical protein
MKDAEKTAAHFSYPFVVFFSVNLTILDIIKHGVLPVLQISLRHLFVHFSLRYIANYA